MLWFRRYLFSQVSGNISCHTRSEDRCDRTCGCQRRCVWRRELFNADWWSPLAQRIEGASDAYRGAAGIAINLVASTQHGGKRSVLPRGSGWYGRRVPIKISSPCNLCVLCVFVVCVRCIFFTTETQRTQWLHREEFFGPPGGTDRAPQRR